MSELVAQTDFPFLVNEVKLKEFLTRYATMEDEEDRLREEKRLLKVDYETAFPMRAVLTALKVVRAQRKLAEHPKEPCNRVYQAVLEAKIEHHLAGLAQTMEAVVQEAQRSVTSP